MGNRLGKVVKSNDHVDYVVHIYGVADLDDPPDPADHAFGTFVAIPVKGERELVGVVYTTLLVNPDYGSGGPRLSPREQTAVFAPDYLDEKAILVGVAVLGERQQAGGGVSHRVPPLAAEVGAEARRLEPDEVVEFHRPDGVLRLAYLPRLLQLAGPLGASLAMATIDSLLAAADQHERRTLKLVREHVDWQSTVGARV
jgi:hypothetical protein